MMLLVFSLLTKSKPVPLAGAAAGDRTTSGTASVSQRRSRRTSGPPLHEPVFTSSTNVGRGRETRQAREDDGDDGGWTGAEGSGPRDRRGGQELRPDSRRRRGELLGLSRRIRGLARPQR